MVTQSALLLIVFVMIGQFVTRLLGKGVAKALQLGVGAVVGVMLLRHFPEAANTVARVADTLWPAIQGFINNGGRQVADTLRGMWR